MSEPATVEPRCFLAIPLPLSMRLALSEACQYGPGQATGLRIVPSDNYHITLRFLGRVDMERIRALIIALSDITQPSFELTLSKIAPFPSNKSRLLAAYVDASDELVKLVGQIEPIVARCGFTEDRYTFLPHVTLARAKHTLHCEPQRIKKTFTLERWGLYQSVFGKQGVSYHPLATFSCS